MDDAQQEQPEGDREPGRRADRRESQHPVRERLLLVPRERLSLGPLAPRDLERRPQVGERVSGPELPARLVEVEADDRAGAAPR